MKRISEGAEAEIYETTVLGISAIVKDRVKKAYRIDELDHQIREQRTKSEARILSRASQNGANVPRVLLINKYQIFMNKIKGKTLNLIILGKEKGNQIEKIVAEAGEQLAALHNSDIVHGDYTPANIMVGEDGIFVIDFGLGDITNSAENRALDVVLMKRSISKKLYEIFAKSYISSNPKDGKIVMERLFEIEKRGRYQTRTLISKA
jgi:Kae1-associated kinase Bud32